MRRFGQYTGTVYRLSSTGSVTVMHSFGEGPGFGIGNNPASDRLAIGGPSQNSLSRRDPFSDIP
jgi:hypothetical protein